VQSTNLTFLGVKVTLSHFVSTSEFGVCSVSFEPIKRNQNLLAEILLIMSEDVQNTGFGFLRSK
jgi:hypothetical protein